MKLNLVNKIYIAVALLLAAIAYRRYSYQAWNRYYYDAGVCAPQTYPVYVREMYFITSGGDHAYIDTEDVNSFRTSWKMADVFPEANRVELLPEKIVL